MKFEFYKKVNGKIDTKPFYVIDNMYGCDTTDDAIKFLNRRVQEKAFKYFNKNDKYIIKEKQ